MRKRIFMLFLGNLECWFGEVQITCGSYLQITRLAIADKVGPIFDRDCPSDFECNSLQCVEGTSRSSDHYNSFPRNKLNATANAERYQSPRGHSKISMRSHLLNTWRRLKFVCAAPIYSEWLKGVEGKHWFLVIFAAHYWLKAWELDSVKKSKGYCPIQ